VRTFLDCVPCIVRQSLDAVRMVTDDESVHENVLRRTLRDLVDLDFANTPPAMAQRVHRLVRKLTGDVDAYRKMKEEFNQLALEMLPRLRSLVTQSDCPLETAVRLAIAGNVIDAAVNRNLNGEYVSEAVEHALTAPLEADIAEFADAVSQARTILYLADNAGEIVFDRLLIKQLPPEKVTVVVKGAPVINDATMADARVAGITDFVEVIDNGSDAPGTIISDCSEAFRQRFNQADLVIAKGQGNYETLSGVEKNIFFVLKAKCPVIARHLGCQVGSLVLRRSDSASNPARPVMKGS